MTKAADNSDCAKSGPLRVLEYVLLGVCFSIIAVRGTFTEGIGSLSMPASVGSSSAGLIISTVIVFAFAVWIVSAAWRGRFSYRLSAVEIGLAVFVFAGLIAIAGASNKRAAITEFAVTFAPFLMAILLTQLLDSAAKVKFALALVAGLGVVSAWQCADQLFASDPVLIERYEQDPASILEPLGVAAGSFEQMLFEHRLYSRGVRGFFTNRNSAGSFALLAVFAGFALFWERIKNLKRSPQGLWGGVKCSIAFGAVIFGLLITKSKGAIAGAFVGSIALACYILFPRWLKRYGKIVLIVLILLAVAGGGVIVSYGFSHDRLPGGSSMLVRWQYWQGAARMYADNPARGVGPGNFANAYTHYKPDAALEAVADPHNFLLSILTQYGPLGLAGFLVMVMVPLLRRAKADFPDTETGPDRSGFRKLSISLLIVISAAMLIVRPMLLPMIYSAEAAVMIYIVFIVYILPVILLVAGAAFITGLSEGGQSRGDITARAILCGCAGLLIHNLIDFAIFEPGVLGVFLMLLACLIAIGFNRNVYKPRIFEPAAAGRIAITAGGVLLIGGWIYFVLLPAAVTTKIERAKMYCAGGYFAQAHELLASASQDDPLNPAAAGLNGRLYLDHGRKSRGGERIAQLTCAEQSLREATRRDRNDYKNYERLSEVYELLAEAAPENEKQNLLEKAFDAAEKSVELYPGLGRLRLKLAEIAEKLGKPQLALEAYRKAVDIEDAYRRQFEVMYPGREVFSRLGEENYRYAKERIEALSVQGTP